MVHANGATRGALLTLMVQLELCMHLLGPLVLCCRLLAIDCLLSAAYYKYQLLAIRCWLSAACYPLLITSSLPAAYCVESVRGPKLGTYSEWGLSSVLVINKHLSHHHHGVCAL